MSHISSLDNPRIKAIEKLKDKRTRDKTGLFLIEGYRELLRACNGDIAITELYICPELFLGENENALIDRIKGKGALVFPVTAKVFQKISYRDRPDGLLAIAKKMELPLSVLDTIVNKKKTPLFVIAEAIEKPGNLGTILRSADGAGADAVIICDRCTDIYNPNVVRSSVGTLFTIPVLETSSVKMLEFLQKHHIAILAATPHASKMYSDVNLKEAVAIAFGTEQLGLSPLWMENATYKVKIPMHGVADSLNVAMASTILLYEAERQRRL